MDTRKTRKVIGIINPLSAEEKVILWRALGEALLEAGNSFDALIAGMPRLEQAVYKERIDALKKGAELSHFDETV